MKLTPEMKEITLRVARESTSPSGASINNYVGDQMVIEFVERFLAALPKPEPVHWRAILSDGQQKSSVVDTPRIAGFSSLKAAEQFCAEKKDFKGWIYEIEPLFPRPATTAAIEQRVAEACAKVCLDRAKNREIESS